MFSYSGCLGPACSLTTLKSLYIPNQIYQFPDGVFFVIVEGEEKVSGSGQGGRLEKRRWAQS